MTLLSFMHCNNVNNCGQAIGGSGGKIVLKADEVILCSEKIEHHTKMRTVIRTQDTRYNIQETLFNVGLDTETLAQ